MCQKFFWGAATSAHQVEGGNHNDWTEWECAHAKLKARNEKLKVWPDYILKNYPNPLQEENYISGHACDHYNRFEEDFDIAKKLGHNAHRFSIEWSRIEPEEGKFNEKEIEHYREVIRALRKRDLEPFVTLWHWTLPIWLRDIGGVKNRRFPQYFSRYAGHIVEKLKDSVKFWITLNEPTTVILNSYYVGTWPPEKKGFFSAIKIFLRLSKAHKRSFKVIHQIDPAAKVGFANILLNVEPNSSDVLDYLAALYRKFWANIFFIWLVGKNNNDYLAIQYYFHFKMKFPAIVTNENKELSDLGWEIYPEGIYHILKNLKKYNLPIYITENGVADARDIHRTKFIKEHIKWIRRAMAEGIDVRGYFHWSLLDNFEWGKGFWPRFGLVEVDYKTMERKIRSSAWEYKKIIENYKL